MNVVFVQNVSVNLIAAKRKLVVLKEIAVHQDNLVPVRNASANRRLKTVVKRRNVVKQETAVKLNKNVSAPNVIVEKQ